MIAEGADWDEQWAFIEHAESALWFSSAEAIPWLSISVGRSPISETKSLVR